MSLVTQFPTIPANAYYEPAFRAILEDHMQYLRLHPKTVSTEVIGIDALRYAGDLYGYLTYNKIGQALHWIILRMNNFVNPAEFDERILTLLIPDAGVIDGIKQQYSTVVV